MSIVGNVIVVPSSAQQSSECGASIVGYKSVLPISSVTGAAEDAAYPFVNALDYQDNTKYSPSATSGSVVITFTQTGISDIDYLGIGIHNGLSAGLSGKLECLIGGTWTEVCTFAAYGDNKTIVKHFDKVSCQQQRLTLNFTSKLYIGSIYVGKAWVFVRLPDSGFQPAHLNNIDKTEVSSSETGQFIRGRRKVVGYQATGSFSFINLSGENSINANWPSYQNHIKDAKPVFFLWNTSTDQGFYGMQDPNNMPKMPIDSLYGRFEFDYKGRD